MTSENVLGREIKQQRISLSLTLQELAGKSGVSASHLGRIERGERFPTARVLRKIAKPLGFEEDELFIRAGYLSPPPITETETITKRIDPYVAKVLAEEPAAVQGAVLGILSILKFVGKATRSAELPNVREYLQLKYPHLDENSIAVIEDLVASGQQK